MGKYSENDLRDELYSKYKENMYSLIKGRQEIPAWHEEGLPPLSFYLKKRTYEKINSLLDELECITLIGKEVRLHRNGDSTTRIDLLAENEGESGLTIIELKKTGKTARESFTELLAYSNHFCTLFPLLNEQSIRSVLISPMDTRVVRDAYLQELFVNNKNVIALTPKVENDEISSLEIHYPSDNYFNWYANNIFADENFVVLYCEIPLLEGWIDVEEEYSSPNKWSAEALNSISNHVAQGLERAGLSSMVYARQRLKEHADLYYGSPNAIIIVTQNPYKSMNLQVDNGIISSSNEDRSKEIQYLYDQLEGVDDFAIESFLSGFENQLIKLAKQFISESLMFESNNTTEKIEPHIEMPEWFSFKRNMIEAVVCHNHKIYTTGMIRDLYQAFLEHAYSTDMDLSKYSYGEFHKFLRVWLFLEGFSYEDEGDF